MKERKKQSFFKGAMILSVAAVIVKILGAIFKIPLTNILGGDGMGYFSTAYDIYMPVYVISNAGLPVAIARIVAESMSEGRYRDVRKTLKIAKRVFLITGTIGFCIMFFGAKLFVNQLIQNPGAYLAVMAMAPTVFFVCLTSAYKGYYEGLHNMYPTAIAQVVEVVIKLIFGFGLSMFAYKIGMDEYTASGTVFGEAFPDVEAAKIRVLQIAAAGAILGVALGALGSWLSAFLRHKFRGDGITENDLRTLQDDTSSKVILRKIIKTAIPIALGSCVGQITGVIDLFSVYDRLHHAVGTGYDAIKEMYGSALPAEKALEDIPNYLNGCYKGMAVTLYNLIPTFTVAFGVSALPAITEAWTQKNYDSLKENVEAVLRVTMLLVLPAGIGMSVMSHGVLTLLYGGKPAEVEIATPLLAFLGIAVIFSATCSPINSMLQAVGRADIPVKVMAACAVFKLLFNYITVGIPEINILGAAMGTLLCYVFIMTISMYFLIKITKLKLDYKTVFLKPLISALLCGGSAYLVGLACESFVSEKLSAIIGIGCGGIVYVVALFVFGAITEADIRKLPKGEKLAKLYAKLPGRKKKN
ncbi:MAG: polysaccharide biosynthesis protein [Oscillospiraceae bacterium]|nr:polysaccharide biosynthesis protein [Oscillospiraceae bacterium]